MRSFSFLAVLLALTLGACGSPMIRDTSRSHTANSEEPDEEGSDEEGSDESDEEAGDEEEAIAIALGERTVLTGTGVSLQPPEGSEPHPLGAGFLSREYRVQVSVVVAEGPPEILDALRGGGGPDAPEVTAEEELELAGQMARLGRDEVSTPQGDLERSWVLSHDGTRALAVIATYEQSRAQSLRPLVEASLRTTEWDREATLDAGAAMGIAVGEVEGLELSHRSSAAFVMLPPGVTEAPTPGQTMLNVTDLPMRVPQTQQTSACTQLLDRLMGQLTGGQAIVDEDSEASQAQMIEDGTLPGCERTVEIAPEGQPAIVAYVGIVFQEERPLLVTASAAAGERETWAPRFATATRQLHTID